MIVAHDPGDEHTRDPLPEPIDAMTQLIREIDPDGKHAYAEGTFWAMACAEQMRSCCDECALEANGEDGS